MQVMCHWSWKLILKAEVKLKSYSPETKAIKHGHQATNLTVTSLTITRLLPIDTNIMYKTFDTDISKQTRLTLWKPCRPQGPNTKRSNMPAGWTSLTINRLLPIYASILLLKFGVDMQSQTKVRIRNRNNTMWRPVGRYEIEIVENQKVSSYRHKRHAYEIRNWDFKANSSYAPETMLPTVQKQKYPIRPPGGHFEYVVSSRPGPGGRVTDQLISFRGR